MASKKQTQTTSRKSVKGRGRPVPPTRSGWGFPLAIGLLIVAFGVLIFVTRSDSTGSGSDGGNPNADPAGLAGIQRSAAPWSPETSHLKSRLQTLGLPAQDGTALHTHQHLDIYIEGKKAPVPPNIGIDASAGYATLIHSHDASGVLHLESPVAGDYTLGEAMDIWGVYFTPDCIGAYCSSGGKQLQVFVNGKPYTGDPTKLVLQSHQEIVIAYGTKDQLPSPIPKSYKFPPGE